jgi:hypothetical protein
MVEILSGCCSARCGTDGLSDLHAAGESGQSDRSGAGFTLALVSSLPESGTGSTEGAWPKCKTAAGIAAGERSWRWNDRQVGPARISRAGRDAPSLVPVD